MGTSFEDVRVLCTIASHPDALVAGAAGVGVYVAALAHCRAFYGDARVLPVAAVRALLGGAGARALPTLARLGWFVDRGETIEVVPVFELDEGAERVARRRERGRVRAQRHRERHGGVTSDAPRNAPSVTETVTSNADVTPAVTVSPPLSALSPSPDPSLSAAFSGDPPEKHSAQPGARGETLHPMADDAELPEEWGAAVAMFGVQAVDEVWLSFRAHHIAKGTTTDERGWRALFVDQWCPRERRYQAGGRTGPRRVVQQPAPGTTFETSGDVDALLRKKGAVR